MLRVALTDLQGTVIARREERTNAESCQATVEQICSLIRATIHDAGRDLSKLFAIGIGAPGMTDVNSGRVISATNLVGWTDVPLRDLIQARMAAPVRVDNDANMAALGERWMGVARSASHFVFLALGAGVGAGDGENFTVSAMTTFDDGSGPALYVGGSFVQAGGITVNPRCSTSRRLFGRIPSSTSPSRNRRLTQRPPIFGRVRKVRRSDSTEENSRTKETVLISSYGIRDVVRPSGRSTSTPIGCR